MSNRPAFDLCVKGRGDNERWTKVGAIWENEKNGKRYLSIKLNSGVAIVGGAEIAINGFEPSDIGAADQRARKKAAEKKEYDAFGDDDIQF